MVRLFIPSDHTGGAPRYAVGWAMMNRVSYRLCVPEPLETGDLYVLNPLDAEP